MDNQSVQVEPERLQSGLWGLPEGDISKSYSAQSYGEKGKATRPFFHPVQGALRPCVAMSLSSQGHHRSSGRHHHREAKVYPLMPSGHIPQTEDSHSYTGNPISYGNNSFVLGNPIDFVQRPLKIEEIVQLFRRKFAYGGLFASEAGSYSNYLAGIISGCDKPLREALAQESNMPQSQEELRGHIESMLPSNRQQMLF